MKGRRAVRALAFIAVAAIWGAAAGAPAWAAPPASSGPQRASTSHLFGHIVAVSGDTLTLRLRTGRKVQVDIAAARAAHRTGVLPIGGAVMVNGTRDAGGRFHAVSVGHASPDPHQWAPDD